MDPIYQKAAFAAIHPCLGWLAKDKSASVVQQRSLAAALAAYLKTQPAMAKRYLEHSLSRSSPSVSPSLSISASPSGSLDVNPSRESVWCHACGARHDLGAKRCRNCGLFLHNAKAADFGTLTGLPADPASTATTGGYTSRGFAIGDFCSHAASGTTGKLLMIVHPNTAILLQPDGTLKSLPLAELETSAIVRQPMPGGTQGSYEGAPAPDLAAAFSSQSGMHALAKATIRKAESPFDRFMKVTKSEEDSGAITEKARSGGLRKRWSGAEFTRGRKVRHKATKAIGTVQQSAPDVVLVEYIDVDGNQHWQLEKIWAVELV